MKTEKQLSESILEITIKIHDQYPELSKYLAEIPITVPIISNPEINIQTLTNYYKSLENILKEYTINHPRTAN
ncbi:hypothetical protein EKL97_07230 [Flavobacterium sp. LS1P28]|uniref:Uncharacterized protein n=1 Tax=Flavobacterium bomense TaxID=2497483 RepID=A0A3S0Q890_9FLAO|nr:MULTISPECIES: hypothetical protein [Flavobacterium]RTY65043.1 hypothetical protein EKL95_13590 [Flavobacterium sp. LB2P53]RTY75419.1 hypothetical protein EKL96_06685 [Flavobacterium sp. LS1R10]RTY82121.1 hypothetical protein EKL97_07230 [Flavobacterium sp. LS1P28]RTY84686.1 hypothetical protein EKL99_01455 [Flavobacterium sp. ZB4P23]RTY91941.1 hypothetical protein EKM01_04775 [Flavobacterium sp. RSP46]